MTQAVPIRSSTILPARREEIDLRTADGLTLVGELAVPAERPPVATLVMLHPLPTHGGYMDSHVFRKAAWRLPALVDYAVLRFNFRGVSSRRGTSDGEFGGGERERLDVAAAIDYVSFVGLPRPWLVGWSFGTEMTLMHGLAPMIEGAVLLSPPLHRADDSHLSAWGRSGKPMTVLVPELDDYLRPKEAMARFSAVPQAHVISVPGAKHLWVGEKATSRVLDEIVTAITPDRAPLPTTWVGPYETATLEETTP